MEPGPGFAAGARRPQAGQTKAKASCSRGSGVHATWLGYALGLMGVGVCALLGLFSLVGFVLPSGLCPFSVWRILASECQML